MHHVPRRSYRESAQACLSCSQTLRRLAHRAKAEALKWEADGNLNNYTAMRLESDRLWRDAKHWFRMARQDFRSAGR